jgi:nucleotide-binding universal stress UspA family protein
MRINAQRKRVVAVSGAVVRRLTNVNVIAPGVTYFSGACGAYLIELGSEKPLENEMAYKTILTFLASVERANRVLDVALPIAEEQDAHVIGVHIIPDFMAYYGMGVGQFPAEVIDLQRKQVDEEAERVRAAFEKRVGATRSRSEWRSARDNQNDEIQQFVNMSMCADLIVTDQNGAGLSRGASDVAARMVLGTARPVLVVPSAGTFTTVGKKPLIAWNGDKEAVRAAFDAVPLMRGAELVRILSIDAESRDGGVMLKRGDELAVCLARHGLKTETTSSITAGLAVGDELLNRLSDFGSDLLVMGCYGHSRFREMLFGGVSRDILEHMTVPVLMSH